MTKVHYVDFWFEDWLGGTSELTLEERGFYITAVALVYARGGPVERDHVQKVCAVHGHTFNRLLRRLVGLGKLDFDGILIGQKRAQKELKKSANRAQKWRKNLDNHDETTTSDDRAEDNARATHRRKATDYLTPTPYVVGEDNLARATPPLPSQGDGGAALASQEPAVPTVYDDPALKAYGLAALSRCLDAVRGRIAVMDTDAAEPPPLDPRLIEFRGRLQRLNALVGEQLAGDLRDQAWTVLAAAAELGDPLALPDQMAADLDAIERLHYAEAAE